MDIILTKCGKQLFKLQLQWHFLIFTSLKFLTKILLVHVGVCIQGKYLHNLGSFQNRTCCELCSFLLVSVSSGTTKKTWILACPLDKKLSKFACLGSCFLGNLKIEKLFAWQESLLVLYDWTSLFLSPESEFAINIFSWLGEFSAHWNQWIVFNMFHWFAYCRYCC